MKVVINLRYLQRSTSGIERLILEMITALAKEAPDLVLDGYVTDQPFKEQGIARRLRSTSGLRIHRQRLFLENALSRLWFDAVLLGRIAERKRADVVWGPSFSVPLFGRTPSVVTIYDVAYHYFPHSYDRLTRLWHRVITPRAARKASVVVTTSEHSSKDICRLYGVAPEKVVVIPGAAGSQFKVATNPPDTSVLDRFGITAPFFLTVSLISPRKNLEHLIRSYTVARRNGLKSMLVLIGRNGWLSESVYEAAAHSGYRDSIIFTGALSDTDLLELYHQAIGFVYPSLYEGFGLPILEAMACGTPVIASNSSSLPEVAGDAAILVSPSDEKELAEAMIRLEGTPDLGRALRQQGLDQAARFSWEASASQLADVLRRLART